MVPKPPTPEGKKQWRMVVDYRYLNSQTKDDAFPLPLIENLIGKQVEHRLWSIFDLEDGFHQMHLDEDAWHLTAFVTPWGTYEFTVLPMGIKNGPAMFQRMIMWILRDLPQACGYIDDVLVGSGGTSSKETAKELLTNHFDAVCEVLEAFRRHRITAKGSKVHLFMTMIKFCGHILSEGKRRAAPSKLQAIAEWQPTMIKSITNLRGFLGLAQYYSTYVKDFASIAAPLTEQLKSRTAANRKIVWSEAMYKSFEELKQALMKNVVLDIADPCKPFVLEVDASDYAVGGVLSQKDAEGNLRPVAFFSRKLEGSPGKGQMGWSVREKETYAIVLTLQKFRSWLASSLIEVLVVTDHKSLQHWYTEDLSKMVGAIGRRGRWHEFLSKFNLLVTYVPGKEHQFSDALSRWAYPAGLDADVSFHGALESAAYAEACDAAEAEYDSFALRVTSAITGKPVPCYFEFIRPAGHEQRQAESALKAEDKAANVEAEALMRRTNDNKWKLPRKMRW